MAKAAPIVRSFNAGEVSPLTEGRTDLDRYPSSNRKMLNYVAAPQGPAIGRSGTMFIAETFASNDESYLIPFVFDDDVDFTMIEFTEGRCRFFTEDGGLLAYAPVAGTVTSTNPLKIDSAALGANVGDQVGFGGFDDNYSLNSVVGNITAKAGTVYTFDTVYPAGLGIPGHNVTVARIYHIVSPYTAAQAAKLKDTQSLDVIYLTVKGMPVYKLKRSDTYSWAFEKMTFIDGPYLDPNETDTTLTPDVTGKATPNMTSDILPAGWTASGSGILSGTYDYFKAFDGSSKATWWDPGTNQTGTLQIHAPAGFICDGYCIHIPTDNQNATYSSKDMAPSDWDFNASNDGVNWTTLDTKNDYVLYDSHKSLFFPIANTTAYTYYQIVIRSCTRNGTQNPRISELVLRSTTSVTINLIASGTDNINNGQGFLATDVGRLMRLRGGDEAWRPVVITAFTDATHVQVKLLGEPFSDLQPISQWQLGYYSDTTGYPHYSTFFQDRLWFLGSTTYPDLVVGSVTGKYDNMAPSDETGTVLDTSALSLRLNSRKLATLRWAEGSKNGLLLGTGSEEYIIKAQTTTANTITPGNAKAERMSSRGSADVIPVQVDDAVLYIQRAMRSIREFAYNFQSDSYKSPSMSTLSSHLGVSKFEQIVYAAEPFSIIWCRRENGTLVGMTYNRDENVIGWHRHQFPDSHVLDDNGQDWNVATEGFIESIAVMPSSDRLQDDLWIVMRRTVNGVTKRYIERLTRFWDFDMVISEAHFVDCALRYDGAPTNKIYGFSHLEGKDNIYGLADGMPVGPFTVQNGAISLDDGQGTFKASSIILGIGFTGEGETSRLENGAADGTAQGKTKRIHQLQALVWSSWGGELGVWNDDIGEVEYTSMEYLLQDPEQVETPYLFSGILMPVTPAPNYERQGSVSYRRKLDSPLPFNIVALMPQLETQDAG